jgi:serine/threonine-protein kinase
LKFLPASLERDPAARERLLAEVRSARTVSHPNVCRVYDVGDVHGRSFLTMEYIDGEDLASLLRRIGRLPAARALEVARQLCAGLAAAHDKGVLHRDLKPANVMIDGRGQARITDFVWRWRRGRGSPSTSRARSPTWRRSGFTARQPRCRAIYALGLILYETYTGNRRPATP